MAMTLTARIEEWRSQLLDTSKRNRLISLNLGRAGAVKLVHPVRNDCGPALVTEGKTMSFPLKRELMGMPRKTWKPDIRLVSILFDPETETKSPAGMDRSQTVPGITAPCERATS